MSILTDEQAVGLARRVNADPDSWEGICAGLPPEDVILVWATACELSLNAAGDVWRDRDARMRDLTHNDAFVVFSKQFAPYFKAGAGTELRKRCDAAVARAHDIVRDHQL